ncbi:succinate dehydrogenase, hydrophobic membrane anchor protein [Rhodobaculum claviforme]|uniref:Succinate dehydrogenase hydrophobic membrane anchor subunit n=1 Tax=Rhodobaculum claviforme TaxID=1549854 RepID=A0A934TM97_9RHOB|nr:succinate dehydrogenase, hydrophobic membrane anchor protein [Rhodobaculum claviforme]MBK5928149.1 succinate dehydrogenase, hydrophobic membrane anchor protein [Rhodobaculum claviforme]
MAYKTDYARVRGLGSAHEGVGHWWTQRLTSIALIVLTPLFVIPFGRALGNGHEALVATYSSWGHGFVAAAFLLVGAVHLMHGLQVVIEDYVPNHSLRTALLVANTLFGWTLGAAGVLGVATLLFSA